MRQQLVLVVDDEEDNRIIFSECLTHHGFAVVSATDGWDAIELARRHRPDVVLMDLAMPGVDGWEATHALKADPETAAIPVAAVTAHDATSGRLRAAGFCAYIQKPVGARELLHAVQRCLREVTTALPWIDLARPEPRRPDAPED